MKSIWFKQVYASPILLGEKSDTIRAGDVRHKYRKGENLAASVGPRRPFATLRIEDVELININDISTERKPALLELYPDAGDIFTRISFRVLA